MPQISDAYLNRLLSSQFPKLKEKYAGQFTELFFDIQKKCESGEISTKALDLRGLLDAVTLMEHGLEANCALAMGIVNKSFDPVEQELIRDVIRERIPKKLEREKMFSN